MMPTAIDEWITRIKETLKKCPLETWSRPERVVSKELHDPFRSAGRVFVATRMDPGHYWVCSVSPINGASVPAGGAFPSNSVHTPRDFDGALLIGKWYLGILYTCNVKQRFRLCQVH